VARGYEIETPGTAIGKSKWKHDISYDISFRLS
jgi:hypothetical protein